MTHSNTEEYYWLHHGCENWGTRPHKGTPRILMDAPILKLNTLTSLLVLDDTQLGRAFNL